MSLPEFTQDLKRKFSGYFNQPKYSDLTVTCGSSVFKVYKLICCAQSKFFETCCEQNMKEMEGKLINFPEDAPEVVEAMLRFFYKFDYSYFELHPGLSALGATPALFNAQVYAAAEKYEIPDLQSLARIKFEAVATKEWNTQGFVQAVRYIYEHTPAHDGGLREVVGDVMWKHIGELGKKGGLLEELPREVWGVGKDLVMALAKKHNSDIDDSAGDYWSPSKAAKQGRNKKF